MSEKSLVDQIRHYQKDIERCPGNAERMLRCIKRLYVLPINVQHLSETGVGRSVNGLRKIDGPVAEAATALVAKWKAMVAAEDSDCEGDAVDEHPQEQLDENDISSQLCNGSESPEQLSHAQKSKDKENVRNNHSVKIKSDSKSRESKETPKPDREKKKENSHREHSSSKSSSKDKSISSGKSKERSAEKVKSESKYHHEKHSSSSGKKEELPSKDKKKDKHTPKEKKVEKHSISESKHSIKHRSKEHSKSHHNHLSDSDTEVERKKPCKRKHSSQHLEGSYKKIKIKQEPKSESEPESEAEDSSHHSRHSSAEEDYSSDHHDSDDVSREPSPEPRIKPEPVSDRESDSDHSSYKKHSKTHHKSSSHSKSKSKHSDRHSSPKKRHSEDTEFTNQELEELIKQNEKMIKKEKVEVAKEKKSSKSEIKKPKIKIEANQDGSIDSGSGASFADALLKLDSVPKKKKKDECKKKKSSVASSPSKASSVTSSNRSSPAPSVTSSVGSSPAKPYKHSSTLNLMKEPELLSKRIKLESPMDLDISSTLPEISTNYRPLPQIPQKVHRGAQLDENAMFAIMTTKNQRTKVFSGSNKKGYLQQVPSLYTFCIQVLYDNIDGLEYTGGVPYEILKPLLDKLSADQLLSLEHFNPYLVEDTDSLWEFHAKKDFRTKQREEDETWREFYLRCIDEREYKLKKLTSNIIESMAKSTPVRQAKLAYVDTVAKPPRSIARKQAKFGTGSSGSGESAKIAAAAQNAQKKKEIVTKAVVGGFTPSAPATDVVPASPAAASPVQFNNPQAAAKLLKKKKAPLMAKALQLIKSNSRYKR